MKMWKIGKVQIKALGAILTMIIVAGCSSGRMMRNVTLHPATAPSNLEALHKTASAYYSADTVTKLKGALADAKRIDVNSAIYHELAADMARLNSDKNTRFDHLYAAILTPDNEMAHLHMRAIYDLTWSLSQNDRARAMYKTVWQSHPDKHTRAIAGHYYSLILRRDGDLAKANAVRTAIGGQIPFHFVGTWDNKQGKGFSTQYPPETEIDLDATYAGQHVDITWRDNLLRGAEDEYDLTQQMYPHTSSVVYAYAAPKMTSTGKYELHINTADGIKVWVNGTLIYAERNLTGWVWDQLTIPVQLKEGTNHVLIKSVQQSDTWDLGGRLCAKGGAPLPSDALQFNTESRYYKPATKEALISTSEIIDLKVAQFDNGTARRYMTALHHAKNLGVDLESNRRAEAMLQAFPNSIHGRMAQIDALWNNQQLGRTADLLQQLAEEMGDELLLIKLKQIRFWRQRNLDKQAREATMALFEKHSDQYAIVAEMVNMYEQEGWLEDKCHVLEDAILKWPEEEDVRYNLATCYGQLGYTLKEQEMFEQLLRDYPHDYTLLGQMFAYARQAFRFADAKELINKMIDGWPERPALYYSLAALALELKDPDRAMELYETARQLNPDSPHAHYEMGSLNYYRRNKSNAIKNWQKSLARKPDDGALAERLEHLAPPKTYPWESDIPDDDAIETAIASRDTTQFDTAADTAWLLDHCVANIQQDGSSTNVTTVVQHALNASGRDALTEFNVPCFGYARILKAFAIHPDGRRTEPTSIRGKTIRFRQLEIGSTIVVQNRCEESADGYVGDYYSYEWYFQAFAQQFVNSQYILWAPESTSVNQFLRGNVEREETVTSNGLRRISWQSRNTPILKSERAMPTPSEIVWMLRVSTVPDWDVFLKWEEALLQNVFEVTPSLEALAAELFADTETVQDKLYAIQAHLMKEIRYQQDYENHVAGVKPHTASQVVARGYGDCKDKSVLFITLARMAGVHAQFALVRTRPFGPIVREVPSQQFNHAIVYIPAQEGLPEGRFFDATADAMDVDVIRTDNPGTMAMVLDEQADNYSWVEIPYQAPSANRGAEHLALTLNEDGTASGKLTFDFKGHLGAVFRITARNKEKFQKTAQILANAVISGATVQLIDLLKGYRSVYEPFSFSMDIKSDAFARLVDQKLKFKIPRDAKPETLFNLENREFDLVMGSPNESKWQMEIALPPNSKGVQLPANITVDTPCIYYSRTSSTEGNTLFVQQQLNYTCPRIKAADYPMYRAEVQKIRMAADEDVVVTLKK